jgi:3'-phosphoadenosine 5'-phosphosulfate sulfotransferase (PAPS reductase)/FAD synthetase
MIKYISFSGGVESTTMCLLYGKGATAIWCDTGAEHKEMYNRIDKVEQYLKDFHSGDFNLIRIGGGGRCTRNNYTRALRL